MSAPTREEPKGATPAIQACGDETGHARVEGTHSCRCGHRWFKYATAAEQQAAQEANAAELLRAMERLGIHTIDCPLPNGATAFAVYLKGVKVGGGISTAYHHGEPYGRAEP